MSPSRAPIPVPAPGRPDGARRPSRAAPDRRPRSRRCPRRVPPPPRPTAPFRTGRRGRGGCRSTPASAAAARPSSARPTTTTQEPARDGPAARFRARVVAPGPPTATEEPRARAPSGNSGCRGSTRGRVRSRARVTGRARSTTWRSSAGTTTAPVSNTRSQPATGCPVRQVELDTDLEASHHLLSTGGAAYQPVSPRSPPAPRPPRLPGSRCRGLRSAP